MALGQGPRTPGVVEVGMGDQYVVDPSEGGAGGLEALPEPPDGEPRVDQQAHLSDSDER